MKKQMRDKITILIKDYNIKKLQDLTAHIFGMEKVGCNKYILYDELMVHSNFPMWYVVSLDEN
jgi:hypothetical protein